MQTNLLSRKIAIVTGAASGLGRAMAMALLEAGATIAAVDLDRSGMETLGQRSFVIPTDVSNVNECRSAVEQTLTRFGQLDILVNCAGVAMGPATPLGALPPVRFWETLPEGWVKVQQINSAGAFFMARFSAEHLMQRECGRIINITTTYRTMGRYGLSAYGPSKAALEASSAVWAAELSGTSITVNTLFPGGRVDTPMLTADERQGELLSPDIMGPPVVWLASHLSNGISGRRLNAKLWDVTLPQAEAAEFASAPIGFL